MFEILEVTKRLFSKYDHKKIGYLSEQEVVNLYIFFLQAGKILEETYRSIDANITFNEKDIN